jgi:sarcosine oxidase subunit alpha
VDVTTVHLTSHRNIKPVYQADIACFVPGGFDRAHFGAGGMVGTQTLASAVHSAWVAAGQAVASCGGSVSGTCPALPQAADTDLRFAAVGPITPARRATRRSSISERRDVDDVGLAHREVTSRSYTSRYTTLSMGTDRGKTSNLNASSWRPALPVQDVRAPPHYSPVTIGAGGRSVAAICAAPHAACTRTTA